MTASLHSISRYLLSPRGLRLLLGLLAAVALLAGALTLWPLTSLSVGRLVLAVALIAAGGLAAWAAWAKAPAAAAWLLDLPAATTLRVNAASGLLIFFLLLLFTLPVARFGSAYGLFMRLQPTLAAGLLFALIACLLSYHRLARDGGRELETASFIALSLLYIGLRLDQVLELREPRFSGDTPSYLTPHLADSPFGRSIFFASRAFTLPLVYGLLGREPFTIAWTQSLVSIAAWLLLAWTLAAALARPGARLFGFVAVLGVGITQQVIIWDWNIRSESLAFSLMALTAAAFILFLRQPGAWRLLALSAATLLWANTRDVNAWIVLMAALPLLAAGLLRRHRPRLLGGLALGLVFAFSFYSATVANRGYLPTFHTLTYRTLYEPGAVEFFRAQGMPPVEEMAPRIDIWPPEFFSWVANHGQGALARYQISRLPYSLLQPFLSEEFPVTETFTPIKSPNYEAIIPAPDLSRVPLPVWTIAWLAAALLLGGLAARRLLRHPHPAGLVALGLAWFALPAMVLTWHGDAWEPARHLVGPSAQYVLGIWILAAYLLGRDGTTALKLDD